MFDKLLIANRGEIACRVAHSCRRLGIATVAVYSDADADALHVERCDEAYRLGPAPARESYLRGDAILEIAYRSGAQAIHPGYGFLAENAPFAESCERAGLIFVGPPAAAIRAMGSKSAAKTIMERAGVPLVPGYHGDDQTPATLRRAADSLSYPVLIKAVSGGGGKGMRVVEAANGFDAALAAAQREAAKAFGDERVLIEKYLSRPRHIEMQIFADAQGNVVHLFERDCSLQRRHQKILEEAPAPGVDPARRRAMAEAAIAAARAIAYRGAGTVEFIVEDGRFYFMEMNTRLQVEHPVSEMITGLDLVEWQLRVAAGEPLPRSQDQIRCHGHAMEARLYAEDPARDFLPATGTLTHLRLPAQDSAVRIDSGVRQGDSVGVHYDPMIAKLIAHGEDRATALRRLRRALRECRIAGVTTNAEFLVRLLDHEAFAAGELHTGFIAEQRAALFGAKTALPETVLALAALGELLRRKTDSVWRAQQSFDPWSPWHAVDGWRLNDDNDQTLTFVVDDIPYAVVARCRPDGYRLDLPGASMTARGELREDGELHGHFEGSRLNATWLRQDGIVTVLLQGQRHRLHLQEPLRIDLGDTADDSSLNAPMPGTVIQVLTAAGAPVRRGETLMVLEAMKMEHNIVAPRDGRIEKVNYAVGEQVEEGKPLLSLVEQAPGS